MSYEITDGNDEGYFALNEAGDAIVLTDDGAQAIRNGQFDPAGASVTVTGTQEIGEGENTITVTGVDDASVEVPMPDPEPEPIYGDAYLVGQNAWSREDSATKIMEDNDPASADGDGFYMVSNPQFLMIDLGQPVSAVTVSFTGDWQNNSGWDVFNADGERLNKGADDFPSDGTFQAEDGSEFQYIGFNSSGGAGFGIRPEGVTLEGDSEGSMLIGTEGDDILIGGPGDDILTGGAGDDIFRWNAGDEGTSDAPANDVVTDFGNGDNVLDLKDLLQGESEENIADYIIAEQDGADTKLYVNSQGGLNGDTDNANQVITLKDVQYSDDIVKDMLDSGQLTIDQ